MSAGIPVVAATLSWAAPGPGLLSRAGAAVPPPPAGLFAGARVAIGPPTARFRDL